MKTRKPAFENRVRFNWGFHDAAQVVRQGWNKAEANYGFGPSLKIESPLYVLARHPDKVYAHGWFYGYYTAMSGRPTESSEAAWAEAKELCQVAE